MAVEGGTKRASKPRCHSSVITVPIWYNSTKEAWVRKKIITLQLLGEFKINRLELNSANGKWWSKLWERPFYKASTSGRKYFHSDVKNGLFLDFVMFFIRMTFRFKGRKEAFGRYILSFDKNSIQWQVDQFTFRLVAPCRSPTTTHPTPSSYS